MISDPARYAADYLKAGCNLLTFHLEAVPRASATHRADSCQGGRRGAGDQSEDSGRLR